MGGHKSSSSYGRHRGGYTNVRSGHMPPTPAGFCVGGESSLDEVLRRTTALESDPGDTGSLFDIWGIQSNLESSSNETKMASNTLGKNTLENFEPLGFQGASNRIPHNLGGNEVTSENESILKYVKSLEVRVEGLERQNSDLKDQVQTLRGGLDGGR